MLAAIGCGSPISSTSRGPDVREHRPGSGTAAGSWKRAWRRLTLRPRNRPRPRPPQASRALTSRHISKILGPAWSDAPASVARQGSVSPRPPAAGPSRGPRSTSRTPGATAGSMRHLPRCVPVRPLATAPRTARMRGPEVSTRPRIRAQGTRVTWLLATTCGGATQLPQQRARALAGCHGGPLVEQQLPPSTGSVPK